ncbi:DEAD/DEAH box helicase [Sulfurospirillum barnesii]|uniref:Superfamily II helicase n=1 Tax=Sulfurospirillum barnesii (strain ATCC 700032 / DSM 10660 / SES-3) TaxID=760154 RepID=I3XUP7_SULBS|nr:DEAD/DEAH box helicase [Sulfurospirillum barnesii]AFL67671.1 superfamily II helicase [Sulfurospirillum barnesii SES-3]
MNESKYIEKIINEKQLSFDECFELSKVCMRYLASETEQYIGRKIIIYVLEYWGKIHISTYEVWADILETAGFYPYLEKFKDKIFLTQTAGQIRKEFHLSNHLNYYFHEEQKIVNDMLNSEKNLIVSAPTSFGKSLLIEEIVASKKYKNIVIIQPTLALLDETRKKLRKYSNQYKIVIKTSQKPDLDKGNIFLLTAERVIEYNYFTDIDFFIIDEFYKLSQKRDDERFDKLNIAFYELYNKYNAKFYMLGPNIDGISEGFEEHYNEKFYPTNFSLVEQQTNDDYIGIVKQEKEIALFNLLFSLKSEQNLIYCSSPKMVRELSNRFLQFLIEQKFQKNIDLPIIQWLELYMHNQWSLIECLKYKIGIHDGALQKHITSSIIEYFNESKINFLFCTSTIIEGVNTNTKNIIVFSNKKGPHKIDYFDYKNIKGRAGRMMEHLIGKIYNFYLPPLEETFIVDMPFFEQNEPKKIPEILINLDSNDILNHESETYLKIQSINEKEREIIRKNRVSVFGQKRILEQLKKDIHTKYELIFWTKPTYPKLEYVFSLCWDTLKKPKESMSIKTYGHLSYKILNYLNHKNMKDFIEDTIEDYKKNRTEQKQTWQKEYKLLTDAQIHEKAILDCLQIYKHWITYKAPKWLQVVNELQKYVCEINGVKPGNYLGLATILENDFLNENLTILLEYGIPSSAINKIKQKISKDIDENNILNEISTKKLYNEPSLLAYERNLILNNVN